MKNTLVSLFLLVIISAASELKAQNETIYVQVSAKILDNVELTTLQGLRLSKSESENNIITVNPLISPNAGKMVAKGAPDTEFSINFIRERILTRIGGTERLTMVYNIAANAEDNQQSAELLDGENEEFTFNESGEFYLWIGGRIDISTAVPGSYSGDFTLEVEYVQ